MRPGDRPPIPLGQKPRLQLGELLIEKGLITEAQLAEALVDRRLSGGLLGEALVWVSVPELPAGAKTSFWLYYGNPAALAPQYDLSLVAGQLLSAEKRLAALGPGLVGHADPAVRDHRRRPVRLGI